MKKFFLGYFLLVCVSGFSQTSSTSGEVYLGLRKLNVLGSVLYLAAHPDDENTRLLAYLSKDKLYRTGYLSLTRGDGGQNLIGEEQGIELGLIRTQELLAARRIDGAEQFFSRAYDFGYSKTPEETFQKWDKQKILSDVVWVIRQFQPDVIITRFPTTGEGGHGHHTASAILAVEAFAAAADPTQFPEQLKYVKPWQAKRLLWNTFNFGGNNQTRDDQFKFDVGGYNAVLGKSYGEIAAESRSQHKSQGFGVPKTRGEALEFFKAIAGGQPSSDLFEDVNTGWSRVAGGDAVQKKINEAIAGFDFLHPERSVPALVEVYRSLKAMPSGYWRNIKMKETKDLIEQAGGIWIEAFAAQPNAVKGDSLRVNFVVNNRLGINARLDRINLNAFDTTTEVLLGKNKNLSITRTLYVPESTPVSQPYWLENPMSEGSFNVNDQQSIGAAEIILSNIARIDLTIEGESLSFIKPVKYKFTDPVRGEQYQPLVVLPAMVLSVDDELKITRGGQKFDVELTATSKRRNVSGYIRSIGAKDEDKDLKWTFKPRSLVFSQPNATEQIYYNINASKDNEYSFQVQADSSSQMGRYFQSLHEIRYEHIPNITYFTPAKVKNVKLDLVTKGKRIGYIVGAGDKVPEALEHMGYEVVLLHEKELARNNLSQFDAIITGVRAYNTNEWMNKYHSKLMKYVEEGGNFIVQYNTSNQIGPVRAKIGPYNFNISRNRITDETAEVRFLDPGHPVLNFPNKITAEDFKGWIQERSIYHASDLDKNFQSLLAMKDPGENEDNNSLVVAKYGKGYFTYTGLAFFRQLPAGVPGAYRLFANLIALNQKKEM
jgi:LmbE family N-acetylglucosaminyl deacetylase